MLIHKYLHLHFKIHINHLSEPPTRTAFYQSKPINTQDRCDCPHPSIVWQTCSASSSVSTRPLDIRYTIHPSIRPCLHPSARSLIIMWIMAPVLFGWQLWDRCGNNILSVCSPQSHLCIYVCVCVAGHMMQLPANNSGSVCQHRPRGAVCIMY